MPRRGGMVRNFMHLGLGQVTTTLLTILLNATLARALSSAEFGLLFLVISIAAFTYVVVDWGYGPLIIREAARHPHKAGELLGSASASRVVGALLACPVAVATTWLLGYDLNTMILTAMLILCWLPQYIGLSFGWIFRSRELMDRDALLQGLLKLLTLAGSIACLAVGGHLFGLMAVWGVAGCATFAVAVFMYRRLRLPALSVSLPTVRMLFRDGAPIFALSVAGAFELYYNANVLFKMASAEVVGWFGAAWTIAGTLIAPATIMTAAMYPRLSMAAGDAPEFKRAFEMSFRPLLLFAVLGSVGTYLFADVPVALIYSLEKFGPSADILRAFALVLLLVYIDLLLSNAILAAGKSVQLAIAKAISVAVHAVLVFILVPVFQSRFGNGGLGVMYSMAIGELLMLVAAGFLVREIIDFRTMSDVLRASLAGAATVLVIRLLPEFTPLLGIPLCVALFGALSLLVGALKRSDIEILKGFFRRGRPEPAVTE